MNPNYSIKLTGVGFKDKAFVVSKFPCCVTLCPPSFAAAGACPDDPDWADAGVLPPQPGDHGAAAEAGGAAGEGDGGGPSPGAAGSGTPPCWGFDSYFLSEITTSFYWGEKFTSSKKNTQLPRLIVNFLLTHWSFIPSLCFIFFAYLDKLWEYTIIKMIKCFI